MRILYWGQALGGFQGCLESQSNGSFPDQDIHGEASLDGVEEILRTQRTTLHLVVLAPETVAKLEEVLTLAPLLHDLSVIVLLPNDDGEAITLAHRLHPRFVTLLEGNLENAAAVAGNILKREAELPWRR
jgi:hypothetical protein